MRLRSSVLVAAMLAAAAALVPAGPATAATPAVMFTRIYYDSPGTDSRANASLNAEYVQLRNTTRARINLHRWTVRDKANHVYTFAGTFYLNAGATVTLRTGKGTNTATNRYWGSGNYIWNNGTDTGYLRNAAGATVDSCAYNSTAVDYKVC